MPADAALLGEPNDIPPTDAAIDAPMPDAAPPRPEPEFKDYRVCKRWDSCKVDAKSSKSNSTIGSGKLRGTVMSSVTAGMIGHSGTTHAYSGCKVIAYEDNELAIPHEITVKNGKYSMTLSVGRYLVSFDDCIGCEFRRTPIRIGPNESATASIECNALGQ